MSKLHPRRSARTVAIKSESTLLLNGTDKHATAKPTKNVRRTTSQTVKRVASPTPPSPKKRLKVTAPAPSSKALLVNKEKPAAHKPPVVQELQSKPYFNQIPAPPEHIRPSNQLFFWGAGNFGQFGAGLDCLKEHAAPKKNALIDGMISRGEFGSDGAGLEAVAAGGLHSLFIDEQGTVCCCGLPSNPMFKFSLHNTRFGPAETTMMLLLAVSPKMSLILRAPVAFWTTTNLCPPPTPYNL